MLEVQSTVHTLDEVLASMAPFAGGSIPDANDSEYTDWVRWIGQKQEEYARRGFWRRCLTREAITLDGETSILPIRFHKPNGLWMLVVDGVDWNETPNSDEQYVFVEMINDPDDANFGRWQMRFDTEVEGPTSAVLWYFSNPPRPTDGTDRLLLPGDMVAYGALQEYFRTTGNEGSEDKAEEMAENRFMEYLSLEVLPDKSDLLTHSQNNSHVNRLIKARSYYSSRPYRNNQS
jgi:hypothetical protein